MLIEWIHLSGCCCSVSKSYLTLCDSVDCSTPGFPVLHHFPELLKLMSIESVMPSKHFILCVPFSHLQSLPASGSFPMSLLFVSGGQSIGVSASASVLAMNIQDWFPWGLTGWISLKSKRFSRVFSRQHHSSKASILHWSVFFMVQLSQPYMTTGKTIVLTIWKFVGKVMSLLFNMLSRSVIAFLPRRKRLLISWLQSPSAVIFSSVQFSRSVVSNSLWPHESQRTRPPCPLPTPGVHSDSHPLSQWCHPAISSSVVPFSSCPQSLPASQSFPMSQPFARGGQSTGASAL